MWRKVIAENKRNGLTGEREWRLILWRRKQGATMLNRKDDNPVSDLFHETNAAKVLLENLKDIIGDDDALATDMVEAETNLRDAINAAVDLLHQDEAYVEAIGERIKVLKARAERLEARAKNTRTAIAVAMDVAKAKKVITPMGTVSIRKTPETVQVDDEASVPSKYFVTPEPKLSRKAVLEALKAGEVVPGCSLSPAGQTIAIKA